MGIEWANILQRTILVYFTPQKKTGISCRGCISTEHNVWRIFTEEFWRVISREEPGSIESLNKYFLCIQVFQIPSRQIAWPLAVIPEGYTSSASPEITFQIICCESTQGKELLPSTAIFDKTRLGKSLSQEKREMKESWSSWSSEGWRDWKSVLVSFTDLQF